MTKTYAILQKKLQELELQLHTSLSHSPNNPTTIHPSLSQEIHQKLLFIANLLSAETASCPTKPRHLNHIARRLARLEATFCDRGTEDFLLDHVNDSSTCSCTESCLNDDDRDVVSHASSCLDREEEDEEGGEFYECMEDEKGEGEEKMILKEEKEIVGVGKLCGAMASGFLIGMALMGVAVFIEFSGYLQVQQNGGFVPPT